MAASEDDIGELLDEVERKFCYSSKTTPTKTFPKTTIPKVHHHGNIKTTESAVLLDSDDIIGDDNYIIGEDEDLDKIVSEIMSDTPTESTSDRRRGKLVGKRNSPSHPLKLKLVQREILLHQTCFKISPSLSLPLPRAPSLSLSLSLSPSLSLSLSMHTKVCPGVADRHCIPLGHSDRHSQK